MRYPMRCAPRWLMDAGGRLARSLRLALHWDSWMWLVMLVAYLSLEALRWTGWLSA